MTVQDLPAVNASLNAVATCLIVAGFICIKRDKRRAHGACMAGALLVSVAFLTCYVIYHANVGHNEFKHDGLAKIVYRLILFTHIPLAAVNVPLVLMTVIPVLRSRFDRHKRWARWTLPVWLYVSVTGVLVYLMLYVWFPAPG